LIEEGILRQFEEIEERVGTLMEARDSLLAANSNLQQTVEELEKKLLDKTEQEHGFLEQRDLVRTKIDALLGKLNRIDEP
jgi:cell division protein ZapB